MPVPAWPNIAAGMIISASTRGTQNGQRIINTSHYIVDTGPTVGVPVNTALNALNTKLQAGGGWPAELRAVTGSDFDLDFVRLQVIYPTRLPFIDFVFTPPGPADLPCLPANCAVSIERRGLGTTRHDVGRMQVPGVPVEWVNDGRITVGNLDNYGPLANALTDVIADGVGVDSIVVPILWDAKAPFPTPRYQYVTLAKVYDEVRTMHRRTVGLGE